MAKLVYIYDDFALASLGASIAAAPSSEDPDYPIANVLNPTRKVRFRTLTTNPLSYVNIDIDLGANFNVGARTGEVVGGIGVHDLQTDAAYGAGPNIVTISAGSSWTALGAISGASLGGLIYWHSAADWVYEFDATYALRYWRIKIQSPFGWSRFSLGKVILGRAANFGGYYSPGSELGPPQAPVTTIETPDGDPVTFFRGAERRRFRFQYNSRTDAHRIILDSIRRQRVPVGLLDPLGNSHHALVLHTGRGFSHQFNNLWSADVEMVQLV